MSCKKYEEWVGLYVEGDLDDRASLRLERHVSTCSRCGELVRGLRESQAALKEWGTADLDSEAFVEMRRRVRKAIAAEEESGASLGTVVFKGKWWRFALGGGLAFLLVGLLFVFTEQSPKDQGERTAEERSPPVEKTVPEPEPRAPEVGRRPSVAEHAPSQTVEEVAGEPQKARMATTTGVGDESPAEDLVVKLVTDDPDIVIYWLVGRNGG